MWWRSNGIADDFTVARPKALLSVASYQGGVQVLWVDTVDAETPLVHTAMVPSAGGGCVIVSTDHIFWHSLGSSFGMGSRRSEGIHSVGYQADFSVRHPVGMDSGYITVRRWQVPYWLVIAVCMALPALVGARAGVVELRGWRRRRAGRCVGCGYDVRVQRAVGEGRCPECGRGFGGSRRHIEGGG